MSEIQNAQVLRVHWPSGLMTCLPYPTEDDAAISADLFRRQGAEVELGVLWPPVQAVETGIPDDLGRPSGTHPEF